MKEFMEVANILSVLSIFLTIIIALTAYILKINRLRFSIFTELDLVRREFASTFSAHLKKELLELVRYKFYQPAIITAHTPVVLGNLNDDISYFGAIELDYIVNIVDIINIMEGILRFMNSGEFCRLSVARRQEMVENLFSQHEQLQALLGDLLGNAYYLSVPVKLALSSVEKQKRELAAKKRGVSASGLEGEGAE